MVGVKFQRPSSCPGNLEFGNASLIELEQLQLSYHLARLIKCSRGYSETSGLTLHSFPSVWHLNANNFWISWSASQSHLGSFPYIYCSGVNTDISLSTLSQRHLRDSVPLCCIKLSIKLRSFINLLHNYAWVSWGTDYNWHQRSGGTCYDDTTTLGGPFMQGDHLTRDRPKWLFKRPHAWGGNEVGRRVKKIIYCVEGWCFGKQPCACS